MAEQDRIDHGFDEDTETSHLYSKSDYAIDFEADIEVSGVPVTPLSGSVSVATTTTLVTPATGKRIKLHYVDFKAFANITGSIVVKIGSVVVYSQEDCDAKFVYGKRLHNYNLGEIDAALTITTPTTDKVGYNIDYEEF